MHVFARLQGQLHVVIYFKCNIYLQQQSCFVTFVTLNIGTSGMQARK